VHYVSEIKPGMPDDDVLSLANSLKAILLTADVDFGELVVRLQRTSHGVILIRLAGLSTPYKAAIVVATLVDHDQQLPGAFCVISPGSIRIRH
jgi:predicted nuclease of predicted toxin-antitoxin system